MSLVRISLRASINHVARLALFHDFTLFVVLSFFTGDSSHASRRYSACVGGTVREKRDDNKYHKIIKWDRPADDMVTVPLKGGSNQMTTSLY